MDLRFEKVDTPNGVPPKMAMQYLNKKQAVAQALLTAAADLLGVSEELGGTVVVLDGNGVRVAIRRLP